MAGKRPARLARASSYYRLAAKADRTGRVQQARTYRRIADQLVSEERREKIYRENRGF